MLTVRQRSRTAGVAGGLVVAGFALPGLVTAFAVGMAFRGTALYLTFPVLIAAYVLHFGGQALRAGRAPWGRCRNGWARRRGCSGRRGGAGSAGWSCR